MPHWSLDKRCDRRGARIGRMCKSGNPCLVRMCPEIVTGTAKEAVEAAIFANGLRSGCLKDLRTLQDYLIEMVETRDRNNI